MKLKRNTLAGIVAVVLLAGTVLGLAACSSKPADVASQNLSNDADNFKIYRQVLIINGITDKVLLEIEGYCSLGNNDKPGELSVTCKVGTDNQGNPIFKKDFAGLSNNVTYVVNQIDPSTTDLNHYQVNFNPSLVVPNIHLGS